MALTARATHVLQWEVQREAKPRGGANPYKTSLSPDRSLQLDCMKSESLVTAGQLNCGEYVPGPCTHRPSRHLSCLHPKSMAQPAREGVAEGVGSEGDEVVTR